MGLRGWQCECGAINVAGVEECGKCKRLERHAPKERKHKHNAQAVRACEGCALVHVAGEKKCAGCGRVVVFFPSKGEHKRYRDLLIEQAAGAIANLRRQVPYAITINGTKVGDYVADFVYNRDGAEVVEDFKGQDVALGRFKRKCIEAIYGVSIKLTRSSNTWAKRKSRRRRQPGPRS